MQSQFIALLHYISSIPSQVNHTFAISSILRDNIPFVWQLALGILGSNNIFVLDSTETYLFRHVTVIQAPVSVGVKNVSINLKAKESAGYEELVPRSPIPTLYKYDPSPVLEYSSKTYKKFASDYDLFDKIFFVKTAGEAKMGTPKRAITITNEVRSKLHALGYTVLSNSDFISLEHAITVLHHASKVITSWGNIAIANRFFYSPSATIVLLANNAYESEYANHIEPMHVFPVAKQYVVRNFPDRPCPQDFDRIQNII